MPRKKHMETLLAVAGEQLQEIKSEYKTSLHEHTVSATLSVKIKNYCENLRSVLDYLAHEIRENKCPQAKSKDRFYFPILPDQRQYEQRTSQWFPNLQATAADVWAALEAFQPYHANQEWIGHFNKVNNENKHGSLVAQTRKETVTRINTESKVGGGSVSWDPRAVTFGSGVSISGVPVDPATQMPVKNPGLKVTKTVWVDFQFSGIGVSAIGLLEDAHAGVTIIHSSLLKLL